MSKITNHRQSKCVKVTSVKDALKVSRLREAEGQNNRLVDEDEPMRRSEGGSGQIES